MRGVIFMTFGGSIPLDEEKVVGGLKKIRLDL
jgi:hypothetical protein